MPLNPRTSPCPTSCSSAAALTRTCRSAWPIAWAWSWARWSPRSSATRRPGGSHIGAEAGAIACPGHLRGRCAHPSGAGQQQRGGFRATAAAPREKEVQQGNPPPPRHPGVSARCCPSGGPASSTLTSATCRPPRHPKPLFCAWCTQSGRATSVQSQRV